MLRLSETLGCRVLGGAQAGNLAELAADPAREYPAVVALRVRAGRRREREYRWRDVESFGPDELVLRRDARPAPPDPELLYLARHVLDLQIVDLVGKRVSRVGDVLLEEDGSGLRVAGVETGAAAVLRRIGLGPLAERLPDVRIDWRDLHPASGAAHTILLSSPAARVHELPPEELAALLLNLPTPRGADVVRALEPRLAGDALALAHEDHAARVAAELSAAERDRVTRHLPEGKRSRLAHRLAPRVPRRFRHILGARRRAPS